jgi:hypothetical protein
LALNYQDVSRSSEELVAQVIRDGFRVPEIPRQTHEQLFQLAIPSSANRTPYFATAEQAAAALDSPPEMMAVEPEFYLPVPMMNLYAFSPLKHFHGKIFITYFLRLDPLFPIVVWPLHQA